MKYYAFKYTDSIEIENAREYVFKTDRHKNIAMFEFNDENYRDFFEKASVPENVINDGFVVFGEDNALYKIRTTTIEKIADKAPRDRNMTWQLTKIRRLRLQRIKAFNKKFLENADDSVIRYGSTVTSFKKYAYVNKDEGIVIPYRLKTVKDSNRPLVIYHGGAGTIGCDNFKTLFEFFNDAKGKKITAANCNILIPQWTNIEGASVDERLGIYADNCEKLIKTVLENSSIDENRVYILGISHGAMITWKSLWKSPELYAASVQAMGLVCNYEEADFNIIKDIPIWIAHSSDDNAVSIDSDDYCYEQLKALGADIKYTRWDKYGHKMMSKFYKQEPWLEWLLSKTRKI